MKLSLLFFAIYLLSLPRVEAQEQWAQEGNTSRGRLLYSSAGALGYSIRTSAGGGWAWQLVDGGNTPYFHVQYPTGNVGIGTQAPVSLLSLKGDFGINVEPLSGGPVHFYMTSNSANNMLGVNARTRYGAWEIPDSSKPSAFMDFSTYNVNNPYYGGIAFFTRATGASGIGTEKMTILNNGNVGVGTTNPASEFQVNEGHQRIALGKVPPSVAESLGWAAQYIGFNVVKTTSGWLARSDGGNNGGSMMMNDAFGRFRIVNIPSTGAVDQYLTENQLNQNTKFGIDALGNVGIGLGTVPRSPLEVRVAGNNTAVQTALIIQQTNPGSPNNTAGVSLDFGIGNNYGNNNIEGRITLKETYWGSKPKMVFSLWDQANTMTDRMVINTDGNVGIGTTSPNQKLTVDGTVYSKEVKVDLAAGTGPDYVFEVDYNLPSLESVKTYIDQNKHLPEVPSAKEMEANGINLGEMNMLLLKKVEELTLYVLELKQRCDQSEQEGIRLIARVRELEESKRK